MCYTHTPALTYTHTFLTHKTHTHTPEKPKMANLLHLHRRSPVLEGCITKFLERAHANYWRSRTKGTTMTQNRTFSKMSKSSGIRNNQKNILALTVNINKYATQLRTQARRFKSVLKTVNG